MAITTRFEENFVSGSGSAGIGLFGGVKGNSIKENTVFNNAVDLGDNDSCTLNTWKDNLFATANNACVH